MGDENAAENTPGRGARVGLVLIRRETLTVSVCFPQQPNAHASTHAPNPHLPACPGRAASSNYSTHSSAWMVPFRGLLFLPLFFCFRAPPGCCCCCCCSANAGPHPSGSSSASKICSCDRAVSLLTSSDGAVSFLSTASLAAPTALRVAHLGKVAVRLSARVKVRVGVGVGVGAGVGVKVGRCVWPTASARARRCRGRSPRAPPRRARLPPGSARAPPRAPRREPRTPPPARAGPCPAGSAARAAHTRSRPRRARAARHGSSPWLGSGLGLGLGRGARASARVRARARARFAWTRRAACRRRACLRAA